MPDSTTDQVPEMIDRVVRVIKQSIECSDHNFGKTGIAAIYQDAARTVIEAMREPTEAMLSAGEKRIVGRLVALVLSAEIEPLALAAEVWQTMVETALTTPPSKS